MLLVNIVLPFIVISSSSQTSQRKKTSFFKLSASHVCTFVYCCKQSKSEEGEGKVTF